jgi:hypothetical protein
VANRPIGHKTITETIHVNVRDIQPRIHEIQFTELLAVLRPTTSPQESLGKCQSAVARSQRLKSQPDDLSRSTRQLSRWLQAPTSIFLIKSGARAEAQVKEFILGVITAFEPTMCPVIWHLSSTAGSQSSACTFQGVARSLIFQALQRVPRIMLDRPEHLSILRFLDDHTDSEWFKLLCSVFSCIPSCFLVVELEGDFWKDFDQCQRLLRMFEGLVQCVTAATCRIKVVLANFPSSHQETNVMANDDIFVTCFRPARPIPARLSRRAVASQSRTKCWRELRSRLAVNYGNRGDQQDDIGASSCELFSSVGNVKQT